MDGKGRSTNKTWKWGPGKWVGINANGVRRSFPTKARARAYAATRPDKRRSPAPPIILQQVSTMATKKRAAPRRRAPAKRRRSRRKVTYPLAIYGGLLLSGYTGYKQYKGMRAAGMSASESAIAVTTGLRVDQAGMADWDHHNSFQNVASRLAQTWGPAASGIVIHKTVGKYVNRYLHGKIKV